MEEVPSTHKQPSTKWQSRLWYVLFDRLVHQPFLNHSTTLRLQATTMPPLFVLLNPFIWLFWAIDLMVWLLFPLPGLGLVKMILTVSGARFLNIFNFHTDCRGAL